MPLNNGGRGAAGGPNGGSGISGGWGGGIYTEGNLSLIATTLSNNTAQGSGRSFVGGGGGSRVVGGGGGFGGGGGSSAAGNRCRWLVCDNQLYHYRN
ncbi:MAG: hypothetical protein RMX97_30740 [Nostoc sp. DedQUE11]|nr:hypothetical protein [Nostoc sp. DedQUE11]